MEELFHDLFRDEVHVSKTGGELEDRRSLTYMEDSDVGSFKPKEGTSALDVALTSETPEFRDPISTSIDEDLLEEEVMDFNINDFDEDEYIDEQGLQLLCVVVKGYLLGNLREFSLIRKGFLQRLLQHSLPKKLPSSVVTLFNHRFVLTISTQDTWSKIFMLIRKDLMLMWDQFSSTEVAAKALVILESLEVMCDFLYKFAASSSLLSTKQDIVKNGCGCIAANIKGLVGGLDPLHTLLSMSGSNISGSGSVSDGTRMVLNCYIRCHILGCLYKIVGSENPNPVLLGLFTDYVTYVLDELVAFGSTVHRTVRDAELLNPYQYECVLELWMVVACVLDGASAQRLRQEGFWPTLKQTLSSLLTGEHTELGERGIFGDFHSMHSEELSLECCWWLVSSLAQLYCYDSDGLFSASVLQDTGTCSEGWDLIAGFLLPKCLACENREEKLTRSLWHLAHLCVFWSPNRDLLLQYWDHIHKALDSSPLPALPNHGTGPSSPILSSSLITSVQLVRFTKAMSSITSIGDVQNHLRGVPWFCHYMAVLSIMFSKPNSDSLWKQIKGRFFSKFHKKRLLELTSVGLANFILLYLTLSHLGYIEDAGGQLATLLVSLGPTHPACQHMDIIWSGLFALLHIYIDCGSSGVDQHVGKLNGLTENLVSSCKPSSASSGLLHQAVLSVFQGVLDLFSLQTLSAIHMGIFNANLCQIATYFLTCSDFQFVLDWLSHMVRLLDSHAKRLRCSSEPGVEESSHLTKILDVLFDKMLPALSSMAEDSNAPGELSSLAIQLSFNNFEVFLGERRQLTRLVEEFGFKESLSVSFAAKFLSEFLNHHWSKYTWLSTEHAQLRMLHTWVRCICQMNYPPGAQEEVKKLTGNITKLPFISTIVRNSQLRLKPNEDPLSALKVVLSAMNGEVTRSPNLQTASEWYQKGLVVFSNLLKIMERGLSGELPTKAMDTCFAAGGVIVSSCPRVIYSRSALQCLLPKLVDTLVMPISHPRRPVAGGVYRAIKKHLHFFMEGLLALEPQRDDFVRRKIKQIFGKYFLPYCEQSQPNPLVTALPNPFLLLLKPAFNPAPSRDAVSRLLFILELIASTHFRVPVQVPNALHVVGFLNNVVSQTVDSEVLARCCLLLLPSILSCLHACECSADSPESKETQKLCILILRKLLTGCDRAGGIVQMMQLHECMKDYVEAHFGRQNQVCVCVCVCACMHACMRVHVQWNL
jgi:hypothetical protein